MRSQVLPGGESNLGVELLMCVNKVGRALSVVQEFSVTGFFILTIVHLSFRAEHVKENGLTYPSPGIANGIKLSPQETRPSSPAALPSAGEKVKDLLLPLGQQFQGGHSGECRKALFCGQNTGK